METALKEEIDLLVNHEITFLQKFIKDEPTESIMPRIVVFSEKDSVTGQRGLIIAPLFDMPKDHPDKLKLFKEIALAVKKEKPDFIPEILLFITEAWAKKFSKLEEHTKPDIESYDDKEEVVMIIIALTEPRTDSFQMFAIEKTQDGMITSLTKRDEMDSPTALESPLTDAFFNEFRPKRKVISDKLIKAFKKNLNNKN